MFLPLGRPRLERRFRRQVSTPPTRFQPLLAWRPRENGSASGRRRKGGYDRQSFRRNEIHRDTCELGAMFVI
eukprot:6188047-Pyramimonas_sp.AAC.1